jgi:hypothetical protein
MYKPSPWMLILPAKVLAQQIGSLHPKPTVAESFTAFQPATPVMRPRWAPIVSYPHSSFLPGNDTTASISTQEKVIRGWKSLGLPCEIKNLDGAQHCQLLVHSPQVCFGNCSFFSPM